MKQREQYVRQATRGLWGRARRELKTELEGHIAERSQEFRLSGLSAAEAERQTLRELGAPVQVSGGMLDVYTAPALGKAGMLSALLATAVFSALPQGLAQVQSIYTSTRGSGSTSYLNLEQLKAEIEKAGGKVSGTGDATKITVTGSRYPSEPLASYGFQQSTLVKDGKTYLQTQALFYALLNSGVDLKMKGWENPIFSAGKTDIHIETQDWLTTNNLYAPIFEISKPITSKDFIVPSLLIEPNTLSDVLSFKGQFAAGAVYTLVIPKLGYWTGGNVNGTGKPIDGNLNFIYSSNSVQDGRLDFHVPYQFKNFKIYSNPSDFQKALKPYNNIAAAPVVQWDAQHPAPVLLLKLNGHFGPDAYTIVSPTAVTQQP